MCMEMGDFETYERWLADASLEKTSELIANFKIAAQRGREQRVRFEILTFVSSALLLFQSSWTYHRARKVWWRTP